MAEISILQLDLKAFEEKYHCASADFYAQFSRGELDDREDYMLWAGLCELLVKNQKDPVDRNFGS